MYRDSRCTFKELRCSKRINYQNCDTTVTYILHRKNAKSEEGIEASPWVWVKIKTEHWSNQFGRDQLEATLRISEEFHFFACLRTRSVFTLRYRTWWKISLPFKQLCYAWFWSSEFPYETPRCVMRRYT